MLPIPFQINDFFIIVTHRETHIHIHTNTKQNKTNLLRPFSVLLLCTSVWGLLLGYLGLNDLSGSLSLYKTESSSLTTYWLSVALQWQMGSCEISPSHPGMSSGIVTVQILLRPLCGSNSKAAASLSGLEHTFCQYEPWFSSPIIFLPCLPWFSLSLRFRGCLVDISIGLGSPPSLSHLVSAFD